MRTGFSYILVAVIAASFVAPVVLGATYTFTVWRQADGLRGNKVTAIATENGLTLAGSNYIVSRGTFAEVFGGVSIFTPLVQNRSWETYTPDDGLASNIVQALVIDEKIAWVGTDWGANRFDTKAKTWATYREEQGLPHNSVNSIAFQDGKVWVGTAKGIAVLEPGANAFKVPDLSIPMDYNVLAVDVAGDDLWLGTSRGGARVETSTGKVTVYSINQGFPSNQTAAVLADGGIVWFGTNQGMVRLEVETGSLEIRGEAYGLPSDGIRVLIPEGDSIWVGTDKGIGLYSKNKDTSESITTADGLPSNNILSMTIKGGKAWVGTDEGLARINIQVPPTTLIGIAVAAIVGIGVVAYVFRARLSTALTPPKDRVSKKRGNPWQICKGVAKYNLCTRCKYLTMKSGGDYCGKYEKRIKIRDTGETRRKRPTGT